MNRSRWARNIAASVVVPLLALLALAAASAGADEQRQAEVATRGSDVMPFSPASTLHTFTKTPLGGVQRVTARAATDSAQIQLVRGHLRDLQRRFLAGDYSGPAHVHGDGMPGLAELRAAPKGQLDIAYRDVPGGAELAYESADARLVRALHAWFDAQLVDHGNDAVAGHPHPHEARAQP